MDGHLDEWGNGDKVETGMTGWGTGERAAAQMTGQTDGWVDEDDRLPG